MENNHLKSLGRLPFSFLKGTGTVTVFLFNKTLLKYLILQSYYLFRTYTYNFKILNTINVITSLTVIRSCLYIDKESFYSQ